MNEIKKKREIIKYSKLFVKKKISPIRSGNISIRHKKGNEEGFLISPSGKKNIDLKVEDIVFVKMSGEAEKKKNHHLNGGFIKIFTGHLSAML